MQVSPSFVGIIPARYSSSRLPGKPLIDIGGKSMIQRVYENASKVFDLLYVATDDNRIYQEVEKFGGRVIMTSPDHRSGTDRCAEAVMILEDELKCKVDIVVNIQGDEPFIKSEQLQLIKQAFYVEERPQIATLIRTVSSESELFDVNKPKVVINRNGEALYFSRSPIPYIRGKVTAEWLEAHLFYVHIGLYAYTVECLKKIAFFEASSLEIAESLEQLRWIENGIKIKTLLTEYESIGIDTPDDLKRLNGMKL